MLLEARWRTKPLPTPDRDLESGTAHDASPSNASREMLYDLLQVCISDNDVPAPAPPWLMEPSRLKGFHDFVLRRHEAGHQFWDSRESSRDVVAVGDLPDPLSGQADLLRDFLERKTTSS
jgi:hypothetical protein